VTRSASKYWGDRETTQYETFAKLDVLTDAEFAELAAHADDVGITFLSTPFDHEAVALLDELDVPAYKIASGDLTHHPLLDTIAQQGQPVILSTGMATMAEVREAVEVLERGGVDELVLLHCTTDYPTATPDANLRTMEALDEAFDYPVGLSDHTMGTTVPTAAAGMGAAVIEKHFTIDRGLEKSPDHRLSATPEEMAELVERTIDVQRAMGTVANGPDPSEREAHTKARRSLVTQRALAAGERVTADAVRVKRPGKGIDPRRYWDLPGADPPAWYEPSDRVWVTTRAIDADAVLTWDDLERQ
jgi:sialic acid synthase SpsE